MKAKKYRVLAVLLVISYTITCLALGGNDKLAWQTNNQREDLAGLKVICVEIAPIEPEVEKRGLRKRKIETQVELRLRQFGLRVIPKKDLTQHSGFLSIEISTYPTKDILKDTRHEGLELGIYALRCDVLLVEPALLLRDKEKNVVPAITWSSTWIDLVTEDNLAERTMRKINTAVDEFINNYLAANPKETPIKSRNNKQGNR